MTKGLRNFTIFQYPRHTISTSPCHPLWQYSALPPNIFFFISKTCFICAQQWIGGGGRVFHLTKWSGENENWNLHLFQQTVSTTFVAHCTCTLQKWTEMLELNLPCMSSRLSLQETLKVSLDLVHYRNIFSTNKTH